MYDIFKAILNTEVKTSSRRRRGVVRIEVESKKVKENKAFNKPYLAIQK